MALDTFGKRIRALRQDQEMSQIELRDRMEQECGVSIGATYISELERKGITPSLEIAAAMARVLDVSLDYLGLLIDDAAASYRRAPTPGYISQEADELAQLVDAMHPSQRDLLLRLAQNMMNAPTVRQQERAEMRDMLDSVERDHGDLVRRELERFMRQRGIVVDSAS